MSKNLKLLSVRLEPDCIESIDQFVKRHEYWTRNSVICRILDIVFKDFDQRDIYDMVRKNQFSREPVTAIYRINKLPSPKNEAKEETSHD